MKSRKFDKFTVLTRAVEPSSLEHIDLSMNDWAKLPHLVFLLKRSSEEPASASETVEPSTSTATPTGTSVIVKPSTSGNLQTVIVQEVTTQEESTAPSSSAEDAGEMVTETVVCSMHV